MSSTDVVVDASVLINFVALAHPISMLEALGLQLIVPSRAKQEVTKNPRTRECEDELLKPFSEAGLVTVKSVEDAPDSVATFVRLVDGTLGAEMGDGEAAAIALADQLDRELILDDKKARRICADHFPHIGLSYTVNLFQRATSEGVLPKAEIQSLLFEALRWGRMAIVEDETLEWVTEMLPEDQIRKCPSLRDGLLSELC